MARGSSFYPAFFLVDRPRRKALWAVYAFNRRCDDLSDDLSDAQGASPQASLAGLKDWRRQLDFALRGRDVESGDAIWPAFGDAVVRYQIPHKCFFDMIDGVSSDLSQTNKQTFADLYRYCYQVASVVGISVVSIFGAHSEEAQQLAERVGVAVQLTNILRDVKEDHGLGRVYLPQEDLTRFEVSSIADSPAMRALLRHQAEKARKLYAAKEPLLRLVQPKTRPCLRAIIEVYERLLDKLEREDFAVFGDRVRLNNLQKFGILAQAWLRLK
jgi:phytoene synthase